MLLAFEFDDLRTIKEISNALEYLINKKKNKFLIIVYLKKLYFIKIANKEKYTDFEINNVLR